MNIRGTLLRITAVAALVFAVGQVMAQTSMANRPANPAGTEKTLTGVVSDSMCGKTHMAKNKSAAECTRLCVQQGQKDALVVRQKVYVLQGHENDLNKLAGQHVTVKGSVSGDTLTVSSVAGQQKG